MPEPLNVLVLAEGLGLTQSLLLSLGRGSDVRVFGPVGDVPSVREALCADLKTAIELVVVALAGGDGKAFESIAELADGGTRVLAVAAAHGGDDAARALASGATGVIRGVGGSAHELTAALRAAASGTLVLPQRDLSRMVATLRRRPPSIGDLTAREREVLQALTDGRTSTEIASMLGIQPLTVRTHLKSIMSKLGVHSKVEVVTFALRAGLTGRRSA